MLAVFLILAKFLTQLVPCGILRVMYDTENISRNLTFLLWTRRVPRDRWISELAEWIGCDTARALEILRGQSRPTDAETEALTQSIDVDSTQLIFGNLLEGTDVVAENIKFLLGSLERGGQKRLAKHLNVTPGSVYKWNCGSQPPKKNHLLGILSFIGLSLSTDLSRTPLFLSLAPIGSRAKREWLIERIQKIDDDQLDQYYPALRKILD